MDRWVQMDGPHTELRCSQNSAHFTVVQIGGVLRQNEKNHKNYAWFNRNEFKGRMTRSLFFFFPGKASVSVTGYKLLGRQQMCHHAQCCCLHGEQVMVFHMWAALPHEFSQLQQILEVVTRLPSGHGDPSSDLFRAGRPQVQGVVYGGDVQQRFNGWLILSIREEVNHLGAVASADHLANIQILERLLDLRACHLKRHTPGASLQGESTE